MYIEPSAVGWAEVVSTREEDRKGDEGRRGEGRGGEGRRGEK